MDTDEVGAFYERLSRSDGNWNQSHEPGIYFVNWTENITRAKAEFEFWFEVKAKNLSEQEFPKAVAVNGMLWLNPMAEGEIESVYAVLENGNTAVAELSEALGSRESTVWLVEQIEQPDNRRYHCVVVWNYSAVGKDWKPGWEFNLQLGISERRTDPLDADTDNDIIADGYDAEPFVPAPLPENPFEDNDGDGLSDYEEVFVELTDPNRWSSDNDILSDGFEVRITKTEPWKEDTDKDGLEDDVEYYNGTNPQSNDTDSDQWKDGSEYNYWLKRTNESRTAFLYCTTPDVDGDSITDYQEVYGYTIRVITCWDENGTPLSSESIMYGDPLGAYKRCDGGWTDTDSDNIPDIVEIYFSNITWIDNDTMWQQMIGD
ncbi:MAG: hypothetical protein QXS83_02715, partial [Thermoplasmata archaeon]